MIALNYPNNPTGKTLGKKTLEAILDIARDHNLYVLSDEVYADYCFEEPFRSILGSGYDKSIIVSSFSKKYAMTGFRVGYSIASEEVIKQMTKIQATGITSVAEPMQYAALAALGGEYQENVATMRKRLDFVCDRLEEMSLPFVKPDGALYVFPQLRGMDDIALVNRLLERGVAVAPGSGFGEGYGNYIRISACQPTEVMARGLDVLSSILTERS
jgi:aspartate aminotransferase